jgi:hypothetical protein
MTNMAMFYDFIPGSRMGLSVYPSFSNVLGTRISTLLKGWEEVGGGEGGRGLHKLIVYEFYDFNL